MTRLPPQGLFFILLGCIALCGCTRQQPPPVQKGPPEVLVSLPVTREITDYEEFSGRLEATNAIQIRARVTGYLLKQHFVEGGQVKKGDLLFDIDPPLYEAELARAKGNLEQAEAHLARLTSDLNRAKTLLPNGTIGREEYDKITGDRTEAVAAVAVAKANLKIAQVNMDYTKVTAPIDGRISRRNIDPGNLVKADDTILTTIGDSDPIKAYFDVDERTVARVLRLIEDGVISKEILGTEVWMGLADEEDRSRKGAIDFFDTYVDPGTGTLRVRGKFPNPEDRLVPGMFVRVRLPIGKPQQATMIAEQALVTDQGQKFVYVIKDDSDADHEGKVVYRPVKLGRLHNGLRVIKEGIAEEEKVVVSGLQRVRPDIKVKFKDVPMPVSTAPNETPETAKTKMTPASSPQGGKSTGKTGHH